MTERRGVVLALALAACGPVGSTDAGTDAAVDAPRDAPSGAPAVTGPLFPFVGEDACYRVAPVPPSAEVAFVWADGSRDTLSPGASEACHTYAFGGPRVLGAIVRVGEREETFTLLVHVVPRPAALAPTRTSAIAVSAGGDVWAVEPDADRVVAISAGGELLHEVDVGDRPRTVAIAGERTLVACQGDGTLHVLGPSSHDVVSFGAGSGAFGVLVDPRGGHAFVSLMAAEAIAVVSLEGAPAEVARLSVGRDVRALAMRSDGRIVAPRWRSTETSASTVSIDASDPESPRVTDETLHPREEGRDSDTDNDGVLSFVDGLSLSPDGGRAVLGALKANVVAGLFRTGRPLTAQTTARGAMAEVSLGALDAPGIDGFRRPLDDLDAIGALTFSPRGETIYLAIPGAEVVLAIDAFSFDTTGSIDDTGHAVDGIALDAAGDTLYVHAALSREVRAYDVSDLSSEPVPRWTVSTIESEPLTPQVLRGATVFASSRDGRMSRTRYLSCASCHRDGESDHLTWDFTQRGEGLRNTVPLRGRAGMAHGPLHWSGNFDEVQDFEQDIRAGQGGTGFLPDALFHAGMPLDAPIAGASADLDALAAYLTSLDAFGIAPSRREEPAWVAAYDRGEAIFREPARGCIDCHGGARFTDSAFVSPGVPLLHDVGTLSEGSGTRLGAPLTGLDTPTLRGLWASAPYLHDGSAPTLRDVLTVRNGGDAHGITSDLSDADLDALITFLSAIDDTVP